MWIVTNINTVSIGDSEYTPGSWMHKSTLAYPLASRPHPTEEKIKAQAAGNTGTDPMDWAAYWIENDALAEQINDDPNPQVTLDGGNITNVEPAPEPATLWLHVDLSGGDGGDPIGIKNDGQDYITVNIALRDGPDPGTSSVAPVNGTWRIPLRDEAGNIWDMVRVTLSNGQLSTQYRTRTGARPALVHLNEADLEDIEHNGQAHKVRLTETIQINVFRDL
ncbi:MAG: hypothetical protein PVG03_01075 [Desulfarculaceae bacterium]|jgi:hypothetical protein